MSFVPKYRFRWGPVRDYLWRNDTCEISVVDGVGDFHWSIEGLGFSLLNATTSGRTNTVISDKTVNFGDSATITVIDSNGYSIEGKVKSCYSEGSPPYCPPSDYVPYVSSGYLYATGDNSDGELGLGDKVKRLNWESLNIDNVLQIAGGLHTHLLKYDGTLWAVGRNSQGQLGLGDITERLTFVQVGTDTDWVFIAHGYYASYAIKSDGSLWSCGENYYGSLGQGTIWGDLDVFTKVGSDLDWNKAFGANRVLQAVKTDGTLWSCGVHDYGVLGHTEYKTVPTRVQAWTEVGRGNPIVYANELVDLWVKDVSCSGDRYTRVIVKDLQPVNGGILKIGPEDTMFVCGDENLSSIGLNLGIRTYNLTQVGSSTDWLKLSDVFGDSFDLSIKKNGTLWGVGGNSYGQLGLGDKTSRDYYEQIGSDTNWASIALSLTGSLVLRTNGNLYGCGDGTCLGVGDEVHYLNLKEIYTSVKAVFPGHMGSFLIEKL